MLKKSLAVFLVLCITILSFTPVFADSIYELNESKTTTGKRMEPLINKYNLLTEKDLLNIEKNFKDITDHWGKSYICKLSALEIISGYGNGNFGPNDTLLAAQYIKMIVMALGFKPEIPSKQQYWIPFVNIAVDEGLIREGEIKDYSQPITRELAAAIAFRALMKFEKYPAEDEVWYDYNVSKITDYQLISDKYKNDVVMAYRMGLVVGSNNLYVPQGTLTRAQAAVIINKIIDKNIRIESVPKPDEILYFTSPDYNEAFFYDGVNHPNTTYTITPGFFPLNELYDVFRTLNEKKGLAKGYVVNNLDLKTLFFSTYLYLDKATADKFYFEDPRIPTHLVGFQAHTNKVYIKPGNSDALNDKSTGYLYAINTLNPSEYNNMFKPLVHEILKTLFENDSAEAIKIHDYYLNLALNEKNLESQSYFLNNRKISIVGGMGIGGSGFRMEIWAKGAIK